MNQEQLRDALVALVDKWRQHGHAVEDFDAGHQAGLDDAADELESLLKRAALTDVRVVGYGSDGKPNAWAFHEDAEARRLRRQRQAERARDVRRSLGIPE